MSRAVAQGITLSTPLLLTPIWVPKVLRLQQGHLFLGPGSCFHCCVDVFLLGRFCRFLLRLQKIGQLNMLSLGGSRVEPVWV